MPYADIKTHPCLEQSFCKDLINPNVIKVKLTPTKKPIKQNGNKIKLKSPANPNNSITEPKDPIHPVVITKTLPDDIKFKVVAEMPTNEVSLTLTDVIDNRHCLPDVIKTQNGIRCTVCRRGFMYLKYFEMHLCTNQKSSALFK